LSHFCNLHEYMLLMYLVVLDFLMLIKHREKVPKRLK